MLIGKSKTDALSFANRDGQPLTPFGMKHHRCCAVDFEFVGVKDIWGPRSERAMELTNVSVRGSDRHWNCYALAPLASQKILSVCFHSFLHHVAYPWSEQGRLEIVLRGGKCDEKLLDDTINVF